MDLVGYCLGGTMALAAARSGKARSVATIAAPWHFDGFPAEARADLAKLWAAAQPTVAALGLLPMEVLQSAFWSLDPERTVAKFEAFAGLEGEEARTFVMLEDWANDGPPLAEAAAREMFETLFADDVTGAGRWRVGGEAIDPAALSMPAPQHRLDHRPDRSRRHRGPRRRAARSRSGPCRHGGRLARAGGALGAARRLAFPHCSKLLEGRRFSNRSG